MKSNIILLIGFLFIISFKVKAQHKRMPLQLYPETGYDYNFLNKNIYKEDAINRALQYGGGLQFGITKKLSLGFEFQHKKFSLEDNIIRTYDNIIALDPFAIRYFESSKTQNAILNLGWYKYNKNRNNLLQINVGVGRQWLNQGKNILAFRNPDLLGALDTIYQNGSKTSGYLGQFNISNTFFISRNIGLRLGIKTQYSTTQYQARYKVLGNQNDANSFENFCKTETRTVNTNFPVHVIPNVGIIISFGKGNNKPKEKPVKPNTEPEKETKGTCINLKWLNKPNKGKCFEGEKLNFNISQINKASGEGLIQQYKVYIAPFNNLSQKQLVRTLGSSDFDFQISSNLLNSNFKYVVIIETKCMNRNYNCVEYVSPIEICKTPCNSTKIFNLKN